MDTIYKTVVILFFVFLSSLTASIAYYSDTEQKEYLNNPKNSFKLGLLIGMILLILYAYICYQLLQ